MSDDQNNPQPPSETQSKRGPGPSFRKGVKPFKPGKPPNIDEVAVPTSELKLRDLDREIEDEMEAALADLSDADLYGEKIGEKPVSAGEEGILQGKVVSIHGGDVFLDVPGRRVPGVLSMMQFPEGRPDIGSVIEFSIDGYDRANGLLRASRAGAAAVDVDWSSVAVGMVVEARVTATNKGGLSVEFNGLRGFMPISQIDMYRVENAEEFVNQRLRCQVTQVEPEERNLVVSRRALLEKEREEQREKFWSAIEEGEIRTGTVRNIKPFGVFVDLGGADGMIPIGELAWARVSRPEDLVEIGQKVQVKVLRIDHDARKISLSLRAMEASPWDDVATKYPEGSTVQGKVTKLMDFGAFVELEPAIEGLVHISELSTQRVLRVRDVVTVDQIVSVQVISVNKEDRKIGLSMRAVELANRKAQDAANVTDAGEAASAPKEEEAPAKLPPRPKNLRGGTGDGKPLFGDLPGRQE